MIEVGFSFGIHVNMIVVAALLICIISDTSGITSNVKLQNLLITLLWAVILTGVILCSEFYPNPDANFLESRLVLKIYTGYLLNNTQFLKLWCTNTSTLVFHIISASTLLLHHVAATPGAANLSEIT